ncbi:MAG TPA: GPW/gp25 family protein [Bryobacteraceae bacterium]|jgi:uncharacterized protein|nr:GPW/gp25 family protein [Bryobacteraceae bacterium]
MQIAFPFAVSELGLTEEASYTEHIRQLIAQVLFTSPGERVNRPGFGCDLRRLVFAARRDELATAVEAMVHGALQQWLGDVIQVQNLEVKMNEGGVSVDVRYVENRTQENRFARFVS